MMQAALDKNIIVMNNILNRTQHRNFDYDFGVDYLGSGESKEKSFRLCDVYDFDALCNNNVEKEAYKEFKELDLKSNSDKKGKPCFETSLFRACFAGDIDVVRQEVNRKYQSSTWYDCIVISIYNDNPYCIRELSAFVKHIRVHEAHLSLLFMAMKKQKKRAFAALVENNIYSDLNFVDSAVTMRRTLVEIYEQTDIPNLAEYIELYKKACKTLQNKGYLYRDTLRELGFDEKGDCVDFDSPNYERFDDSNDCKFNFCSMQ